MKPMSIARITRKYPGLPIASCVYCARHCAVIDGVLGPHCSHRFYQCPRVGLRVEIPMER